MATTQLPMEPTITYLDPYAGPGAAARPYTCRLHIGSEEPVIGLLNNLFIDSSAFLDDVARSLNQHLPSAKFHRYGKGANGNPTMTTSAKVFDAIEADCDAVILAYGHCGSCTASLIRDAAALVETGTPIVALITEKFEEEAAFLSRANGYPDMPIVILPHPIAGETAAYQQAVADLAVPLIFRAFTQGQSGRVTKPENDKPSEVRNAG